MKQLDFTPRVKPKRTDIHFYIYPDIRDKIDAIRKEGGQSRGQVLESLLNFYEENR